MHWTVPIYRQRGQNSNFQDLQAPGSHTKSAPSPSLSSEFSSSYHLHDAYSLLGVCSFPLYPTHSVLFPRRKLAKCLRNLPWDSSQVSLTLSLRVSTGSSSVDGQNDGQSRPQAPPGGAGRADVHVCPNLGITVRLAPD